MKNCKLVILIILILPVLNLKGQITGKYPEGYLEGTIGSREVLIGLDTMVMNTVVFSLANEGCQNLPYFLRSDSGLTRMYIGTGYDRDYARYPIIGFNFHRFPSAFGLELKKAILVELGRRNLCINEIIENALAPQHCHELSIGGCPPVLEVIFNEPDALLVSHVKELIATPGYRIKYNPKYQVVEIVENNINKAWLGLFSKEEQAAMNQEQLAYLLGLGKNNLRDE